MTAIDTTKILVGTGLKGYTNYSILNNVIGQLSDGMWENSRVAEHYWPYVEVVMDDSDNVIIMVHKPGSQKKYGYARLNNSFDNWFVRYDKCNCRHDEIRKFFARKIRALVSNESKCYPYLGIKFNGKCEVESDYFHDSQSHKGHKISDIHAAYKALIG